MSALGGKRTLGLVAVRHQSKPFLEVQMRTPPPDRHEDVGIALFFLGRAARTHGIEEELSRLIEYTGFELLRVIDLNEREAANWPVGGEPPVRMIIGFDVIPGRVNNEMRRLYPDLDNGHIHEAALTCREFAPYRMSKGQNFELVRPSQNSGEAWAIIRLLMPDTEQELRQTIASTKSAMVSDFEVLRELTRGGKRAKIELIRYADGVAVKKTFRSNCLRFMERDASFMDAFSPCRSEIPPVLERGPNYLIMPFIEGRPLQRTLFGRRFPRLMTMRQVTNVADLLRFVFVRGFDPIDLGPHNLLVDGSGSIKAIDFEFAHRSDSPIQPEQSACLLGVREGFQGEYPLKARLVPHLSKLIDPWPLRWEGATGLTLQSFLDDPPWLQRVKRAVNYPRYLSSKAAGQLFKERKRSSNRLRAALSL
jgi:hypothetical protein